MLHKKTAYKVVVERDEDGWYVGSVPALPGCHTQARTLEELREHLKEAIALCLEVAEQDPAYRAKIKALAHEPSFVGTETVTL